MIDTDLLLRTTRRYDRRAKLRGRATALLITLAALATVVGGVLLGHHLLTEPQRDESLCYYVLSFQPFPHYERLCGVDNSGGSW